VALWSHPLSVSLLAVEVGAAPVAAPAFLIFAFGGGCPTTKRHARPCVLVGSASLAAHRALPSECLELLASPLTYASCLPPPPPLKI